jgi:Flp pilus assembly protein CpaB
MRRSPRSIAALVAAVVVAIATTSIVFGDLATLHRRANSLGPLREVLIAARDVPLGTTLGANDLRVASRYASTIPPHAIVRQDDAVRRVVAVPLLAGAVVLDANLTAANRRGLEGLVPPGSRAVRIRTDDGMRPPAGAVVDVLAALDPAESGADRADVVARAARVLAVDESDDARADGVGVTVLVTDAEVGGLAFAAANGVLTLALDPPEDACCTSAGS